MKLFKEPPNVISKDSVWVCFHGMYMYTGSSLVKLLKQIVFEWKKDKHLVG